MCIDAEIKNLYEIYTETRNLYEIYRNLYEIQKSLHRTKEIHWNQEIQLEITKSFWNLKSRTLKTAIAGPSSETRIDN